MPLDERHRGPNSTLALYVYDHCPYCVRVRVLLGWKKIHHRLIFLANDDIETPTRLVGRKLVPILEEIDSSGKSKSLGESLDIIKRLDEDGSLGAGPALLDSNVEPREDIASWLKRSYDVSRRLMYPRISMSANLPELASANCRKTFEERHPFPCEPLEYAENYCRSSEYKAVLEAFLVELEDMLQSPDSGFATGNKESIDDIILFAVLRSLTLIRDLAMPANVQAYLVSVSKATEVPLYSRMAC